MVDLQRKHDTIRHIHNLQPRKPNLCFGDASKIPLFMLKQWFIQSVHYNIWRSSGIIAVE